MPQYSFINDESGEVRDVFFKMNETKEYCDEDGKKWRRLYISPNMSIDTRINPFSAKDFANKTKNAKTYGEMFDLSSEMSEQRSAKLGAPDPQKQKAEKAFYKPKKKKKI